MADKSCDRCKSLKVCSHVHNSYLLFPSKSLVLTRFNKETSDEVAEFRKHVLEVIEEKFKELTYNSYANRCDNYHD